MTALCKQMNRTLMVTYNNQNERSQTIYQIYIFKKIQTNQKQLLKSHSLTLAKMSNLFTQTVQELNQLLKVKVEQKQNSN